MSMGSNGTAPGPRTRDRIAAPFAWLVDGIRAVRKPEQVFEQLCTDLLACGLPLERVAVFQTPLHPDIYGWSFLWRLGTPSKIEKVSYVILTSDDFKANPVSQVFRTASPIRRRIERSDCPSDFSILTNLRADGITDYLIQPLVCTDGQVYAVSWATRRAGGFSEEDVADLEAICGPLARIVEVYALHRTAANLLDTYVGHASGERILNGQIRRGDTQVIRAAILLADLRGFTRLANEQIGPELIALLNGFFDCLVPSVQMNRGEVLKFMGDGLLAIFPMGNGEVSPDASCRAALATVRQAQHDLAAHNEALTKAGRPRLSFGVGLHFGEVVYGNIGAAGRLDFTAIGPSVNLTARLQRLAGDLGRELVASAVFTACCGEAWVSLGRHQMAGFAEATEAFGLPVV